MKTLFVASLLILSNFLYSQNIYIEYDDYTNGGQSKNELIINDSISIWNNNSENILSSLGKPFLIKNHLENRVYLSEGIFNQPFYIKDSLHNMKWELTNETKIILNEKCFSARTYFRGRNYTAFYTTNYANSDGPWKFGGLPGLILEVKSDDNFFLETAVKIIKNYSGKVEPVKINNYKFTEWDEYVNRFIITIDNYVKLARSSGVLDEGSHAKIKIDAPEIIYPKAQLGDGISF